MHVCRQKNAIVHIKVVKVDCNQLYEHLKHIGKTDVHFISLKHCEICLAYLFLKKLSSF